MDDERLSHLRKVIARLPLDEIDGFAAQLKEQGELTNAIQNLIAVRRRNLK